MKSFRVSGLLLITMFFSVNAMERPKEASIEGVQASFQAIQRVYRILDEAIAAFQPRSVHVRNGKNEWPEPLTSQDQTEKGLFIDVGALPGNLFTPWGKIILRDGCLGPYLWNLAFTQHFLSHFKGTFVNGVRDSQIHQPKYYRLKQKDLDLKQHLLEQEQLGNIVTFDGLFQELSKEEFELRKGTDMMIVTQFGSTLFAIDTVDEIQLPKAELLEKKEFRKYEDMKKCWQELKAENTDH